MAKIEGLEVTLKAFIEIGRDINKRVEKALTVSALDVRNEAVTSIARGIKTGKTYTTHLLLNKSTGNLFPDKDPAARGKKRRTAPHRASAPGEAPATDSGDLIDSIFILPTSSTSIVVGTLNPVGTWMEFGTPNAKFPIKARPWLNPAFEANRKKIVKNMMKAVNLAIAENKKK